MRLFVGVALPGPVRDALASAAGRMRDAIPGARWVDPGSYHLTVAFLGSAPPDAVAPLGAAVAAAAAGLEPALTRLTEVGAFPSPGRARVIWAGLADDDGALVAIAAGTWRAIAPLGFEPEGRPYHPHVTLARVPRPAPVTAVPVEGLAFTVDALTVFRSHLGRGGSRYEALSVHPLTGSSASSRT